MTVFVIGLAWVVVHFLVYIVCLRQSAAASSEAGVLRLHAISFAGFAAFALIVSLVVGPRDAFPGFVAAVALHAIYSMTFLEVWSVTQGSFVFHTLSRIEQAAGQPLDLVNLETVGASKRSSRLQGLERLGLIHAADGSTYRLTARGRIACTIAELLAVLTNIRQGG